MGGGKFIEFKVGGAGLCRLPPGRPGRQAFFGKSGKFWKIGENRGKTGKIGGNRGKSGMSVSLAIRLASYSYLLGSTGYLLLIFKQSTSYHCEPHLLSHKNHNDP